MVLSKIKKITLNKYAMNLKNLISLIVVTLLLFSCSGSDDDPTTPNSNNPDPNPNNSTNITYNSHIKSIMSGNFTSCHGNPTTNSAPMSLTTYSEVKNAVETRGLIERINDTNNPMPQGGLMSQTNRDLIQQWKDQGFLEN